MMQLQTMPEITPMEMMFEPQISARIVQIAESMAAGSATVPKHLQGKKGDCLAVAMQAITWKMNPWSVAQKTHLVHGTLGYEAQLVAAVLTSTRQINGRLAYEFLGDWNKTEAPPVIRNGANGDFATKGWRDEDERGLGVMVSGILRGETEPRTIRVDLARVWPRNSGLWATDPQQQICYLGAKRWARRHCPDAILGVYTPDELQEKTIQGEVVENEPSSVSAAIMEQARRMKEADIQGSGAEMSEQLQADQSSDAEQKDEWPKWIEDGQKWCDSDGTIYEKHLHGWSQDTNRPSVTIDGRFRKRRGSAKPQPMEIPFDSDDNTNDKPDANENSIVDQPHNTSFAEFSDKIRECTTDAGLEYLQDIIGTSSHLPDDQQVELLESVHLRFDSLE